jgi:dihydropteroate synthase
MNPTGFEDWLGAPAEQRRVLVMGVLNVTPDSFSDGGRFAEPAAAVEHARQMVADGAELIDIGGESTRPGVPRVAAEEQMRRIMPVVGALARDIPALLSVDTTRAAVAEAALDAGAGIINDISGGLDDPAMLPLAARRGVPIALMHMRGEPATMQTLAGYGDVVGEVQRHLAARRDAAVTAGVERHRVLLDPGIGFAKGAEHNLTVLRRLRELTELGQPLLLGTSRKGFVGRITGEGEPSGRLFGTAATVAWCVANGAAIVRVHDVGPMAKVVRMTRAIADADGPGGDAADRKAFSV